MYYMLADVIRFVEQYADELNGQKDDILATAQDLSSDKILSASVLEEVFDDPDLCILFEEVVENDPQYSGAWS